MNSSFTPLRDHKWKVLAAAVCLTLGATALWAAGKEAPADGAAAALPAKPALSVVLTTPSNAAWPQAVSAYGSIAAWQEASIGAEIGGYRLTEVRVNVGDVVQKGQLLASIASDTIAAELAQSKAALAEAQAMLAEARANADRARQIQSSGAMSAQQIAQYLTGEQTAAARVDAARARVEADELRLSKTRVIAPEAGVISARSAALGSFAQQGQELFRLILDNRLEWRAEVTANELHHLRRGLAANLVLADGNTVRGRVRSVAPTIDPQTRNAFVYVDLPAGGSARAGMFAKGEFELGKSAAVTLPQSAVVLRDGFAYVFRLEDGPGSRVAQTKVSLGRRAGDRVEITGGLAPDARVVASGTGFLADGDVVKVVEGAK